MALITPIAVKNTLEVNSSASVYQVPAAPTSHSIVDLHILKLNTGADTIVDVAVSTASSEGSVTVGEWFLENVAISDLNNSLELGKIIMGSGERLWIRVKAGSGSNISYRVTGISEENPIVIAAGKLATTTLANNSATTIWTANTPLTSYASVSITLDNSKEGNSMQAEVWIGGTGNVDKVANLEIPANEIAILENILMVADEVVTVKAQRAGLEVFVNGIVSK